MLKMIFFFFVSIYIFKSKYHSNYNFLLINMFFILKKNIFEIMNVEYNSKILLIYSIFIKKK